MFKKVAIIGSGPAGLMAASVLSKKADVAVHLFEKRKGFGRKLLIAGSSGLNISHELPLEKWVSHYHGGSPSDWEKLFTQFSSKDWIQFIEKELGMETFLGTSNRYFVKEMKASHLLKTWVQFLEKNGVQFHLGHELTSFDVSQNSVHLFFNQELSSKSFDRACFFMGGGSWEEVEPLWPRLFQGKNLNFEKFEPSNVGYEVSWSKEFLKEAEGKPFKKITLTTALGKKGGELVVTEYGLEGTPIYFLGTPGIAYLDLKPDLSLEQILEKLNSVKENLSPIRRVKQKLALCEAAMALLFHQTDTETKQDLQKLAHQIKKFPLQLLRSRPLLEAISSKGGLSLSEVTENFELKKFPYLYCGGEMLAWDAPTGGFLIQASVSQGAAIAEAVYSSLNK